MKKTIVIEWDTDEHGKSVIKSDTRDFPADGFIIFAANSEHAYAFALGTYQAPANAFRVAATDPNMAGFFEALKYRRQITAEEALAKFEGEECTCVGDGGCVCGNRKIFH